ncbi:DUF3048 domain-containing protein [Clostridium polynesiense]|uniref:DUF3048 domain-containing protein n=1 Tax=Clostridium polynesiense TaxID=1325933 RepID=UPI00058C4640|nr:DUF3048 domain-containing protein [Clostridium polynesiense]
MKKFSTIIMLLTAILFCSCSIFNSKKEDINSREKETSEMEGEKDKTSFSHEVQSKNVISPYTGKEVNLTADNLIPYMAVIENSKASRPQSGLSEASIVFETMAEGGIPRFVALYYDNSAEVIGPIRSARPYFVDIAKEYSLPIAHCGGSEEALEMISKQDVKTLNEFAFGNSYWRDNTRKAPHNLYTSSSKLKSLITEKKYIKEPHCSLKFSDDNLDNSSLPSAKEVIIKPNKNYSTSYIYKEGKYFKSMDDTASADRDSGKIISADNIVIQKTDISLQKDGVHLNINLIGEGEGFLITKGRYKKIKWKKTKETSETLLEDNNGNPLVLSKGNTWWHIIDNKHMVVINGD